MPWKLIGLLLILTLFVIFSGYNAHKITINFGPAALTDIPLFVALVSTFILGAFTALPFSIMKSWKRKKKIKKEKPPKLITKQPLTEQPVLEDPIKQPIKQPIVPPPAEEKKTRKKTKKK